jgi:two-component system, NtrC family, sensor kinase
VIAVGVTVVVAAARLLLVNAGLLLEAPYILFTVAVVVAAWVGGLGPGLLATALSLVATTFIQSGTVIFHVTAAGVTTFLLQGLFISILGATRMRAIDGLARAARELESRVEQRTHDLNESNRKLELEAIERERAAAELRALAAKLEASNRELQDFASVASHDLQEPLRKIRAFGDRLLVRFSELLGDEGADYIRRMQNAAGRMQTLIDDLLSLSRVASRAQPFSPVDLRQITAEVLSDLEAAIARTGARVTVGELPVIEADRTQMRQLLQNLIGNGLKFQPPGVAPEVHVEAITNPVPEGGYESITLTVSDNGIGFDEKYLDRIFTVFQRLHGRTEYEGTGIGLAVCRRIVERHAGTITARSTPGRGATFIVTLPVQQQETPQ